MCYAHLRGHPNILSLLGYGWRHEHQAILPYVVVDYSSHGTFRDFLKAERALDIYRKKRLVLDVACGLDALHSSGIIHGDLKLDNVLIFDRSGDPKAGRVAKICDFGHSLLLSADDEDLVYRGTTIYNAPEVHKQAVKAIKKFMLPRCDIWAFGLLALEVVVDGDVYTDHLGDEIYFNPTLVHDNPQIFCGELLKIAIQLSNRMENPFMEIFFKGLFRRTLMLMPQARTAHLCATIPPAHPPLQVPKKWDWSFDIFHPEQVKGYSWEQQKQIFHNFELSYQRGQRNPEILAPAAFQLGICYLVGFGVSVDKYQAQEYMSKAEQSRHFVSILINPLIQDSTGQDHHQRLYTAAVVRGLAPKGAKSINLPIMLTLGRSSITLPSWSRFSEQIKRLEQRAWVGTISATEGKLRTRSISSIRVGRRDITDFELMPHNWTKAPLNLLECAIMFRDIEVIEILGRWHQRLTGNPGICEEWATIRSETLLTQGCRTGDIHVVKALLHLEARCKDTTPDGCTMLHWLFMLGANVVPFVEEHLKNIDFRELIDLPCTRARDLHKQWPFQLVGTPLAFSIWAGSIDAVTALLKLGANPAAPAFGELESFIDGVHWTHLHLAAMLHHAEILILLIAALDPKKKLRLSTSSIALVLCYSSKVERIAVHGRFTEAALQRTVAALEVLDQNSMWCGDPITESRNYSPLATAIEFNDHDVARALLKRHPHLATTPIHDSKDRSCYTYPAHLAVKIGSRQEAAESISMLEMLFEYNKISFHTLDSSGNSPLHIAVTEYSTIIPRWLLDHHPGSSLLNAVDRDGRTALHYCISADTADLLLQRGIFVDHADEFGMTSLHCAALAGASEVMQVLIRWNADIDVRDITSSSALHHSVASGSADSAHILLVHEPNVQMQNIHGESPLHIVARRQRDDLVRALLQSGSSRTLRNKHGLTPLHIAMSLETSDPRKLVTLCDRGTVSLCDEAGNNIVHHCAILGRFDWLECIKGFSSTRDLCALNDSGQAPIHIAAKKLDVRTARHLLDDQETVNLTDSKGNTAFHIALTVQGVSEAERERFCTLLALKGAALRQVNDDGQTPWSIAVECQSEPLMSMVFMLGGEQACHGIIYHDVMLQTAFGENKVTEAVAYYDNTSIHQITSISRSLLTEISKKYTHSADRLLPLSFQDFDKEVFNPETLIASNGHDLSIQPTTKTGETHKTSLSDYSVLPEAIGKQIGYETGPEVILGPPLPEPVTVEEEKTLRVYEGLVRGLKVAGKVTGGTILIVALLPTMPVLLPFWLWRRKRVIGKSDSRAQELEGVPLHSSYPRIYELEASAGPYELSCFPTEKTVMGVKGGATPEYSEPGSLYIVDPDLLGFLIDEGVSRLLSFAEELEEEEYRITVTAVIEEIDGDDEDDGIDSIKATSGSDTTSSDLTSEGSTNGGDAGSSSAGSIYSTSGFSFEHGGEEITVVMKETVPSPQDVFSECSCAECIKNEFFLEQT